ncbi:MAG: VOC family protein [Actinomycetota bacterium]
MTSPSEPSPSATGSVVDRRSDDVANIVAFEHVNVFVPDFELATVFYVNGLGLTRDPYIDLGPSLMWINAGAQQFHLPKGDPQVLRGTIHLRVPDLGRLQARLARIAPVLAGTRFSFTASSPGGRAEIAVTGPWGNRFVCRQTPVGASMAVGMDAVEFPVRSGAAAGIGRFYQQVMGARVSVAAGECRVTVGPGQTLRFVETADPIADYDGHHLAVYLATVSAPHQWLVERGLVIEETDDHQFRFTAVVDPDTGEQLFEIEHEVRSLHHHLFGRPLVNRNPDQTLPAYVPGADALLPASPAPATERPERDPLTLVG